MGGSTRFQGPACRAARRGAGGRSAAVLAAAVLALVGVGRAPAAMPSPAAAGAVCGAGASDQVVCPDEGSASLSLIGSTHADGDLALEVGTSSYVPDGPLLLAFADGLGTRLVLTGTASVTTVAPSGAFTADLVTGAGAWADAGERCTLGISQADSEAVTGDLLCNRLPSAEGPLALVSVFTAWAPRPPSVRLRLGLDGWLAAGCAGSAGSETFVGTVDGRALELTLVSATVDAPVELLFANPASTRVELVDRTDGSAAT